MTFLRAASAAIVSACLISTAASARDPGREQVSARVPYADLDLSREPGRAVLQRRLRQAISATCGTSTTRNLAEMADVARCRREMAADAVVQVAAVEQRNGVRLAIASNGR